MCGIAGIVYKGGRQEDVMDAVRRMIGLQRHRGPDGEGFYDSAGVSLGHCRLAIIDLSDRGHQPMSTPEKRFWITFNGEIYNYLELAEELRVLGYQFNGQSDTEVLLNAYRCWGEGCLHRLRGMFAFAIWDNKERRLFAARDRLGIKPFHYCVDGQGRMVFASELKALLEFVPERRPNSRLARDYLAWSLLDHDAAETMIDKIKRLPPAHAMSWTQGTGLRIWSYWRLDVNEELETPRAQRSVLIREFYERFHETISLHLRSDIPVGTSLSGGLDSSSIVCVVKTELERRDAWQDDWQHTFSACFEEPSLDERPYIEAVAEATGCRTHFVFPDGQRLSEELDTWIWHQDEPVFSTNIYAHYCVARLARDHGIKVLLDGQGADELLAGYRKFILVYIRQLFTAGHYGRAGQEAMAFFCSPEILRTSRLVDGRRYFLKSQPREVTLLWPGDTTPPRSTTLGLGNSLGRRLEADMTQFSLPVLLRYEDRNTMAFGIESRVPFVDHTFVEWLSTLPADMRLSNGWTKHILREALVNVLPGLVRSRKSKLGFLTPQSKWLAGPLAGWLRQILESPRHLGEVVDLGGVRKLLAGYIKGERSPSIDAILLRLALYEAWACQFLEPNFSRTGGKTPFS